MNGIELRLRCFVNIALIWLANNGTVYLFVSLNRGIAKWIGFWYKADP
jgi:hypothetical protein